MADKTTTTTTKREPSDFDKYHKLLVTNDYDKEAVEQLAAACNEMDNLLARARQLEQIIAENKELQQYVWKNQTDRVIPIHELENDHLSNIMLYLLRASRSIPRAIRAEAMSRDLVIPTRVPVSFTDKELRALSAGDKHVPGVNF